MPVLEVRPKKICWQAALPSWVFNDSARVASKVDKHPSPNKKYRKKQRAKTAPPLRTEGRKKKKEEARHKTASSQRKTRCNTERVEEKRRKHQQRKNTGTLQGNVEACEETPKWKTWFYFKRPMAEHGYRNLSPPPHLANENRWKQEGGSKSHPPRPATPNIQE